MVRMFAELSHPAEELLTLIAKDPEGPVPFPAPYFFIDRFTLTRSSNLEIAEGAMRAPLASAQDIPLPSASSCSSTRETRLGYPHRVHL